MIASEGRDPKPRKPTDPNDGTRIGPLDPPSAGGTSDLGSTLDFRPIHIEGEALSVTILRERR